MRMAIARAWQEARGGNPDRLIAMCAMASFCWAVIVGAVAGLLGILGVITWRDPTGQTIGLIALGPFGLGVILLVCSSPFFALWEMFHDADDEEEQE